MPKKALGLQEMHVLHKHMQSDKPKAASEKRARVFLKSPKKPQDLRSIPRLLSLQALLRHLYRPLHPLGLQNHNMRGRPTRRNPGMPLPQATGVLRVNAA